MLIEANVDSLVGPTHHYGGLGVGNVASQQHRNQPSHPKQAALQGLHKAALVASLGVPQFLWFPPARPRLDWLTQLGFVGSPAEQIRAAWQSAPQVLSAAASSAFMWAANSATVAPASDCKDGRMHISLANLLSSWHRGTEAGERGAALAQLFHAEFAGGATRAEGPAISDATACIVHPSLPAVFPLRDEGAANHMRLCNDEGDLSVHVFVHGELTRGLGERFLPRHSHAASQALARRHQLHTDHTFFLQQHPSAIAAGVFHNDVIATSHQGLLLHHERAFLDAEETLEQLHQAYRRVTGVELKRVVISETDLSLADTVRSYLFNSQIVTPTPDASAARMVILCPEQVAEIAPARAVLDCWLDCEDIPIDEVHFVPLRESMAGGGGPACLRLRLPVTDSQLAAMNTHMRVDESLVERVTALIEEWYPAEFQLSDLLEPDVLERLRQTEQAFRSLLA